MFTNTIVKDPLRIMKDHFLSKIGFYNERMQKSLYSATKKYIGDCDEPKTIYKTYHVMTKIISTPIANIFVGEVSIARYFSFLTYQHTVY